MKRLLFAVILVPSFMFAQNKLTIESFDRAKITTSLSPDSEHTQNFMVLSNGDSLFEGSKLKLGKGTLPNGDFNYIATPSNTMQAKLKRTTTLTELRIIKLKRKGEEKYGYKYFIVTEDNYLVQLED